MKKGFTLIELIIAIFILMVGVIGTYYAFSIIVGLTSSIYSRFTAAYLAQEGLEIMRNMRDNNWLQNHDWSQGLLDCQQGCEADYTTGTDLINTNTTPLSPYQNRYLGINGNGLYDYSQGAKPTIFKRKIIVSQPSFLQTTNQSGDNQPENPFIPPLKVSVIVTWNENGQAASFRADEYLYNWY